MKNKSIQVTQPSIAPLDEYQELLKDLWNTKMLTNNGPFVKKLEKKLCQYLDISNFIAVTNGTIALQIAIKALGLKGEIITTPFTWIATISSIKWENCTPIFCDIDYETLNIDSNKIEQHITDKTVAIMPVHVFGNPCDVNQIEKIAKKNNLKVIYDAAHAIGSTINNKSVLNYGDISATSMHATKIFNTGEGGGCITTNTKLNRRIKQIRFFGHDLDLLKNQETQIIDDGLNGKMSELHAALGLVNLKYQSQIMDDRKRKNNIYKENLSEIEFIKFQKTAFGNSNHSYFPLIFNTEEQLLKVKNNLNKNNIFPRRYFYPSTNKFREILKYEECPVSENISRRILCLPIYNTLNETDIIFITNLIKKSLN